MIDFDALSGALPRWLETRRWFADKGRGIARAVIEDGLTEAVDDDALLLAIVRVEYRHGDSSRYFVPMVWTAHVGASEVITAMPGATSTGAVIDGVEAPWFGRWLIEAMNGKAASQARWTFTSEPAASHVLASAAQAPVTVMRAEQSNTSLRYGNEAMVKLVRRLQPGPNPDEEMLRALAKAGFASVPHYLGGASWRALDGEAHPLALAQAFVPNLGDGWSWMLRRLRELTGPESAVALDYASPERLLGRRTGEMHVALSRVAEPEVAAETATSESIQADIARVRRAVGQTVSLLQESEAMLPEPLRAGLPSIASGLEDATSRAEGFGAEAETVRIRVHGDYHLGQTLRTPQEDWVIIDFEGEPARPVAERRQKTSALKDVAGMLRSFAYARGAAERNQVAASAPLASWETEARQAFLEGYREAVLEAPMALVPADDREFAAALAAWELDKALYEVAYEVRNRPDWVELPLRSLLPRLQE